MNSENKILIKQEIMYGNNIINYLLIQTNRKTLRIEVLPNMDVIVRAPLSISLGTILEKVKKKASWIIKQITFFKDFNPRNTIKKFTSGETFLYLGKQYILKIELVEDFEFVKLRGNLILVYVKKIKNTEIILNNWYLNNAKIKFLLYLKLILDKFQKYNITINSFKIKTMKNRWGSCSKKGNIILNTELIKSPRGCIEYVIIHELCHLIEFGHTRLFYEILSNQMPDWRKWKNKLEKLMA